jgi:hypothetical protein
MAVEHEEMEAAAISETDQDAAVELDALEPAADSSSEASKEGEKFDLLSVVRNAVADKQEDTASPAGQSEDGDQPAAEASSEENEAVEPDDENYSDVPFHNHPRFKRLVAERNQFREGAQQYEQIQSFLSDNGVTPEEAADVLTIRALMKTNPAEAWKSLKPIVQQLLVEAGEVLPDDLKQRVARGEMTRDAALEFSRLRAAQTSAQRAGQFNAQVSQQRQQAEHVRSIQGAVASWEQSVRAKDPDFDKLSETLQKEVMWLQKRDGMPKTPEDARKMVETAYAAVKKTATKPAPKPAVRPVTGGRVASGQPTGKPKTMLDVVRAARSLG